MKNKFKAGDLVFEVTPFDTLVLTVLLDDSSSTYPVKGFHGSYTYNGLNIFNNKGLARIFHATPEMREKLVAIWGEDAVPKLPLRGSELTRKLLKKQKYVLCWTTVQSDDIARKYKELTVIEFIDDIEGCFVCVDGHSYHHAVPVDMDGNEITEISDD